MKKKETPLGILNGLLTLIATSGIALLILHVCDALYRLAIVTLDIPGYSGFQQDLILRNYHAAMRYLSPFTKGGFTLPDLAVSEDGAQHFADTKNIFLYVYCAAIASIVLLALIWLLNRKKTRAYLAVSAWTTLALPAIIGLCIAVDFNTFFVLFHKIFFSNDLWIFDYRTDEIILILPSQFFMYCALFIALCWVVAAIIQLTISRKRIKP